MQQKEVKAKRTKETKNSKVVDKNLEKFEELGVENDNLQEESNKDSEENAET